MGKKEQNDPKDKELVEAVLNLVRKKEALTVKQEKFYNNACIERFLKAKDHHVKKAAKQLCNCLAWRHSLAIDHLIADEFSAELAEGAAYVSGHDDESRPVMIFRIKQDYQKFHSQKLLTRLLVFTLEVAIQTMAKGVEQFVILFDASFFRSASAFMNILLATLKIISEYYPGRLYKAFVIDPPSLFAYLWKGVKKFVDLAALTEIVSSLDFEELSLDYQTANPRETSSFRISPSSSLRFFFTAPQSFNTLKPWSLNFTDRSSPGLGSAAINARSYSFASPMTRAPRGNIRAGFFPSTPLPQKTHELDSSINHPRAMRRSSFFKSPVLFFSKDSQFSKTERSRSSFLPYLKFYRRPYDEMTYRSTMRPPLGGLISIVRHINRPHISTSRRF